MILGDLRASEQPGLASLHTIFLREHNRIAEELSKLNRHWTDEQIYQNARKIIVGMIQHVVYGEFLPRILGWDHLEKYGLSLERDDYFKGNFEQVSKKTFAQDNSRILYFLCNYRIFVTFRIFRRLIEIICRIQSKLRRHAGK